MKTMQEQEVLGGPYYPYYWLCIPQMSNSCIINILWVINTP